MTKPKSGTAAPGEMEILSSGVYALKKAAEFEGAKIEQLTYDMDKLSSEDVIAAQKQADDMRGQPAAGLMADYLLFAILFARAADQPAGFVLKLGARDYVGIAAAAQGFFAESFVDLIG